MRRGRENIKTQISNTQKRSRKQGVKVMLLALPAILIVILFNYIPLWGWSFAFIQYKPGREIANSAFVGWDNFTQLFSNNIMRRELFRVLRNTFAIHFLGYVFSPLPMLFAIFLGEIRSRRFQKMIQTITTLPNFISWAIMFSLATSMFSSNGLFNSILVSTGLTDAPLNILNSSDNVWLTQVLFQQWKGMGWNAIIYFAAIAGIDQGIFEAAMVDGAKRWQKIWYITIPQLIPTFFVILIIGIGNFLNTGVDQYLAFGNALNKEYIETLDLYVYNLGIGSGQISFSVAVGIMKTVVALVLFVSANWASKKIRGNSVF